MRLLLNGSGRIANNLVISRTKHTY